MTASVSDLRRISDAVAQLTGRTVHSVTIRSDCKQLRLALDDHRTLLVSVLLDEDGKPRLDVDVLNPPDDAAGQLEVRFEAGNG
jgi:hypothetical protein